MSLAEQLRRAQELTTQMVGVLDAFDRRLENLQQTIAPVHSVTKKLTTVSLNVEQAYSQLNRIVVFFDEIETLRPEVMTASVAADVPGYLAMLSKIGEALQFLFTFKLKQNEKIYVSMRTLYKSGVERLQDEYSNVLDRAVISLDAGVTRIKHDIHPEGTAEDDDDAEGKDDDEATKTVPGETSAKAVAATQGDDEEKLLLLIEESTLPLLTQLTAYLLGAEDLAKSLGPIVNLDDKGLVPAFLSEFSTAESIRSAGSDSIGGGGGPGGAGAGTASFVVHGINITSASGTTYESTSATALAKSHVAFMNRLLPLLWSSASTAAAASAAATAAAAAEHDPHVDVSYQSNVLKPRASKDDSNNPSAAATTVKAYAAINYQKGSHPLIEYLRMLNALLQAERNLVEKLLAASTAKVVFETLLTPVILDIVNKGDLILLRVKRAVANHDFSEMLVLFDLVSNLGPYFESIESFSLYCGKMSNDVNEILTSLKTFATATLKEFATDIERPLSQSTLPPDGTVHELTSNTVDFLQRMIEYKVTCDQLLTSLPGMLPSSIAGSGRPSSSLGVFMTKVLDALSKMLESLAHKTYKSKPLEAIFLLNNYHYMLKFLKVPKIAAVVGADAVAQYTENVSIHSDNYHSSWKEVVQYLLEVNAGRSLIQGITSDKQKTKDKFKGFNTEFEQLYEVQKTFSIPDPELRTHIRQTIINMIVPLYAKFLERYANTNFTSNPSKYIKFTSIELESMLSKFFDTRS